MIGAIALVMLLVVFVPVELMVLIEPGEKPGLRLVGVAKAGGEPG